jgi:amino acid transporter
MPARSESQRVEARSAALKKELGLRDLVLTQILYVVGLSWVGAAAKLGASQIPFWLAAMALFYVPQAAVVIYLSRRYPLEGGLYQWAKLGLNREIAFLVVWNLWVYAIVLLGALGLTIANAIIYAIGPAAASLSGNRIYIGAVTGAVLALLIVTAVLGLGVSKWVHNVASVLLMSAFALLIALPVINVLRGHLIAYHPLAVSAPALTLLNVNIFGKLAVGALSGFEYVAVLAGEAHEARRSIGRSVLIAAPVIALMFIFGTSAVQALVPLDRLDLIGPIPQAFRMGLGSSGVAAIIVPFAVMAVTARAIGNSSVLFTATTRMPMVAGWDSLLPAWFTHLHPRYRTPINSIVFIGACALACAIAGMIDVGEQEAFQLIDNAAGIFYGLTYLVLFAVPLLGWRGGSERAPRWLRVLAAAGFGTTLLYVILSVLPIVPVASRFVFALKISSVVVGANLVGAALYVAERRRTRARARSADAVAPI